MSRKIRAILIERNDDIRAYLATILKDRGYEVMDYRDPAGCPLASTHDCKCTENQLCADIFVLDLKLSGISGVDFVELQSEKNCKASCVAIMSSSWTSEEVIKAEKLGCAVFDKPARTIIFEHWLDECESRVDRSKTLNDWFCENC